MTTNQTLPCTRNLRLLHEHRIHLERYSALGGKTVNARLVQARRIVEFAKEKCLLDFSEDDLWEFRKSLTNLAVRTRVDTLNATRELLHGICDRHSKEAKFLPAHVGALKPKHHEETKASIKKPVLFPSEPQVVDVVTRLLSQGTLVCLRDAAMISLMSQSGVRIGSLITLRGKDLVLTKEHRTLIMDPREVDTKFSKLIHGRVFRFDPSFDEALELYLAQRKEKLELGSNDPLFTYCRTEVPGASKVVLGRKPWQNTGAPSGIIAKRFEEAGYQRYPAHRLRHAGAQMAVRRAKTMLELKAISQCFGHTSVSLLMNTYGDLNSNQLDEVSLNLGGAGNGELSPEEQQVIALMRKHAA